MSPPTWTEPSSFSPSAGPAGGAAAPPAGRTPGQRGRPARCSGLWGGLLLGGGGAPAAPGSAPSASAPPPPLGGGSGGTRPEQPKPESRSRSGSGSGSGCPHRDTSTSVCVCGGGPGSGLDPGLSAYLGQLSRLQVLTQDGGEDVLVSTTGLQQLRERFDWPAPGLAPPFRTPPFPERGGRAALASCSQQGGAEQSFT